MSYRYFTEAVEKAKTMGHCRIESPRSGEYYVEVGAHNINPPMVWFENGVATKISKELPEYVQANIMRVVGTYGLK